MTPENTHTIPRQYLGILRDRGISGTGIPKATGLTQFGIQRGEDGKSFT